MSVEEQNIIEALYAMVDNNTNSALDMTIANGYNFNWISRHRNDLSYTEAAILTIIPGVAESLDERNNVGVNRYNIESELTIEAKIRTTQSSVDLDEIVYQTKLNLIKADYDIRQRFNSCYNIAGDAGLCELRYLSREFEQLEDAGMFNPVKLNTLFRVRWIENRNADKPR